jgi:methionyl-tRNA formyltransferase
MRILFLSQEESLFLAPTFETVFEATRNHDRFVLLLSDVRRSKLAAFVALSRKFGLGYTAATGADYLVRQGVSVAERLGTRTAAAAPSIAAAAARHGVSVVPPVRRINAAESVTRIRALKPDVIVSLACPQILGPAVLAVPTVGCINVHGGPLPRYRGMHSAFWQLFHGESECATTVHVMDTGIDTGPIIDQEPWTIAPGDTLHDVIIKSKAAGARALLRVLNGIAAGKPLPTARPEGEGSYFSEPERSDILAFRRRGLRLR